MTTPTFTNIEKRAGVLDFLRRQLFEEPTLPHDVDLTGKTVVVTGSNTGIGFECARQLLDLGTSKLIMAVRNESKGQAARSALLSSHSSLPENSIEVWQLDLHSYDSITAFVERTKDLERLDIVILNAGISKQFFDLTPSTGHEETIQVNVISTALLAINLLPLLKLKNPPGQPGCLVIVSSDVASWAKFKERNSTPLLAALDKREAFSKIDRYPTSKLLAQLFVTELTRRVPSSVAVVTLPNPGWCYNTGLGHVSGGTIGERIVAIPRRILGRRPSVGARAVTDAAVHYGVEAHGQYSEDCKLQPKAPIFYKPEGDKLSKTLWDEVMAELSFAKVRDIIQELEKGN
ncbi:retinol dehydrogenase 12 [Daldinia caldariorum]|uniref:retinol dehydrogenase 12 n=1 Tax=Daldinia caldariorum TaxID=326644 RepID=UPI002007C711|nr:retinol dehydrogenase 12 [Daldinia caldariorum]KAI1465638.1 retinol dehydrogenase 12 [Daldinia caldariorum]